MSLNEYRLDKEFDILATWFRVGEIYEDGVKGKLHYSSTSIVLGLYDSFADRSVEKGKEIACLYGISTKGQLLILNNCLRVSEETSSLGFAIESYSIETFYLLDVIGEIPIECSFSEVERIQFSLEHLHSWINPSIADPLVDLERTETQRYPIQAEGLIVTTGVIHHRKRKKRAVVLERLLKNYRF